MPFIHNLSYLFVYQNIMNTLIRIRELAYQVGSGKSVSFHF